MDTAMNEKKEILLYTTEMNLSDIVVKERSQTQK
jgi:hypothetical protein